jgi:hypothetical protein
MKMSRPDTDQTKTEKRKLVLMRQANSAASDKTNIVGARKERGRRPKPVTLPAADELRQFWIGDE